MSLGYDSMRANLFESDAALDEMQQRLRESNALFRVVQGLAENLSLDQLLQLIVDEVTRAVPSADKAVVHLLQGESLEPRALSRRTGDRQPSAAMRTGFGIAGRALQLKQTQYVPDVRLDPDFVERGTGIKSLLVAPLMADAQIIGTLSVDSHKRRAFDESSCQLLALLASQAALAIEKARLFEETLAEKRRLEAILNTMLDGVLMLDRNQCIVSINPALARMAGQPATQIVGAHLTAAPYPLPLLAQVSLSEVEVSSAEIKTGAPLNKTLNVVASPLHDSRQGLGHVLVVHDVTRERELLQLKSDFVANVSHELRTPLFAIAGFVRLLLAEQVNDEATRREFLSIIGQQTEQLTNIVGDLLDVSRLEAGYQIELKLGSIDVPQAARDALARLETLARDKEITLTAQLPDSLPPVRADGRRLQQVLVNLLGNAIKYTPNGGQVLLSARQIHAAPLVEITVSDTGIGIPAEATPHLFERYYQVDRTATHKTNSTGLGLHISRRLVEALGGELRVESAPARGSHFSFTLPISTER